MTDKRQRNHRRSTYRPRSPAQQQRRQELWQARAHDRALVSRISEEAALKLRLDELETALLDDGGRGVHNRRSTVPLDQIEDEDRRFHVLKARVERLEALWTIDRRKRETRGKIIIGGALLAEAGEALGLGDGELLARLLDIVDRRIERARDRLTVRELLGQVDLPLRHASVAQPRAGESLTTLAEALPDFDAMAQSAMAEEAGDARSVDDIDPDHADLEGSWRVIA